jgi:hypothetical protein
VAGAPRWQTTRISPVYGRELSPGTSGGSKPWTPCGPLGADLRGAKLPRANLEGADLRSANLHSAKILSSSFGLPSPPTTLIMEPHRGGPRVGEARGGRPARRDPHRGGSQARDLGRDEPDGRGSHGLPCLGISAWDLKLEGAKQRDLVISDSGDAEVTVDNIEVGQFIYLLLHNEKIRDVIDTIGKKGVLLLGRFTEGRFAVLERLRAELRERDFVPMVFNFDKPETKDFTETVRLLAGLSRFVIADITNPRSAPLELQATMPEYMIPFIPIIEDGEEPFAMFRDLWAKHRAWVLDPIAYGSVEELV